jgi:hypothetical protein
MAQVDEPAVMRGAMGSGALSDASMLSVERVEVLKTAPRVEVKIPMPASFVADAGAWVRLHPAHWRRTYPPRQVNNLYFDTGDYAGLNANLSGVGDRAKLRLRWYGPCLSCVTNGQLELKRKQGLVGWKEIVPVQGFYDLATTPLPHLLSALGVALRDRAPDWLATFPFPVLINCYWRAYYETPDGAVRLTLDTALTVYDQRAGMRANLNRRSRLREVAILELKAEMGSESQRRLSAAVASFPVRVDRFSKYVTGVMSVPDF